MDAVIFRKHIAEKVNSSHLLYDLENFFANQAFIKSFCDNYKIIMMKYLS